MQPVWVLLYELCSPAPAPAPVREVIMHTAQVWVKEKWQERQTQSCKQQVLSDCCQAGMQRPDRQVGLCSDHTALAQTCLACSRVFSLCARL